MDQTFSCSHCKRKVIGYTKKLCRTNLLPSKSSSSGNENIDEFIKYTKSNKKHCDDFIEWIPYSDIEINNDPIVKGGFSKIFIGKWHPIKQDYGVVDDKELINIALKVLNGSKNLGPTFLNEFKIHYQCLGTCAIPFYGLTMHPEIDDYAMIMKHAIHGDLW
ncbi:9874_t:CDS:2 [Dentiscutata erythropus]|uniref:9874_t:CDS:1 n=1 Tax=Dentiscutata erythropus TaxID=1348616 RepID=A0A9N9BEA0_9GLOM|nr:9874_t:CDS:2 [Dentiscutata erythropus]